MKKILSMTIITLLLFMSSYQKINVIDQVKNDSIYEIKMDMGYSKITDTILLDDGSYIIIEMSEEAQNMLSYNLSSNGSFVKKGTKNVTMYDKSDKMLWNYFLTGDFIIIPGESATAISSSYTVTNNTNFWHFSDGASSYSDNVIKGKGVFKHKALFITVKTVTIDISITSDIYGNTK